MISPVWALALSPDTSELDCRIVLTYRNQSPYFDKWPLLPYKKRNSKSCRRWNNETIPGVRYEKQKVALVVTNYGPGCLPDSAAIVCVSEKGCPSFC